MNECNLLGNPSEIKMKDGNSVEYVYAADGTLHDNTVKAAGITINPSNIDIVNYRVDGEFLRGLNKITPNARTYGTTVSFKGGIGDPIDRHSIKEHIRILSSRK